MKNRPKGLAIALLFFGLVTSLASSPLRAAPRPRAIVLGRILSAPPATLNGVALPADATLFSGDRISTGPEGWARILLPPGDQIYLSAKTDAEMQRVGTRLEVGLVTGRLSLHTRDSNSVQVYSNGLEITPRTPAKAVWEVARLDEERTLVAAHEGTIEVRSLNRTVQVLPGQSVEVRTRLEQDGNPAGQKPRSITPDDCGCRYLGATIFATTFGAATATLVPIAVNEQGPVSPSGFAILR